MLAEADYELDAEARGALRAGVAAIHRRRDRRTFGNARANAAADRRVPGEHAHRLRRLDGLEDRAALSRLFAADIEGGVAGYLRERG